MELADCKAVSCAVPPSPTITDFIPMIVGCSSTSPPEGFRKDVRGGRGTEEIDKKIEGDMCV